MACYSVDCVAQEDLEDFSYEAEQDTLPKVKHPSKKAMLYSAILPGAGQIYNHIHLPRESRRKWNAYWKVPLIYGALGGSVYMLVSSQKEIGMLKSEYDYRLNGVGSANIEYSQFDNQAITQLVGANQTRRDIFILTSVLVYFINVIDANIEAHFINFDVSRDLSMQIRPVATAQGTFGLGMNLRFK
jgi:hypothetical protein